MRKIILSLLIIISGCTLLFADSRYYNGKTGSNYVLAIPEARGINLPADQQYFNILLQTQLTDTIQKFSPIQVVDRQNEDIADSEIAKSEDGSYSDDQYIQFGKKLNAKYVAVAQLINMEDTYALSVRIIETEKNAVICAYSDNSVSARLIKNGYAINMAVKDILSQLGIELSPEGLKAINGGVDVNTLKAQENLSKGINASKRGTTVEAMQYYYAAAEYNIDNTEINARLNAIQTAVSSGNLGDQARGEDEAYRFWKKTLNEADEFFTKNPPYEIAYSKSLERLPRTVEELDNEENSIQLEIGLIASNNSKNTIKSLSDGIENSPDVVKEACSIWPEKSVTTKEYNTWMDQKNCVVTVQLINDVERIIAQKDVQLNLTGPSLLEDRVTTLSDLNSLDKVKLSNIKSTDITDNITIRISRITWNGVTIPTDNIRISTAEELKEPFEAALKAELERKAREEKIRAQKEAQARAAREKKETKEIKKGKKNKRRALNKRNAVYITTDSINTGFTDYDQFGMSIGYDGTLFWNLFWGVNTGFHYSSIMDVFGLSVLGEVGMAFGITKNTELYFKTGLGGAFMSYPTGSGLLYRNAFGVDWKILEFQYSLDYVPNGYFVDKYSFGIVLNSSWMSN